MRALLMAGAALALGALCLSSVAAQPLAPGKVGQSSLGPVLTDPSGMTLYTYGRDMVGYSNCNGACVADWPPFAADATAASSGDWTVVVRDDGKKQWAYKGHALYRDSKDAKPGDATGDGAESGKWHIAKP